MFRVQILTLSFIFITSTLVRHSLAQCTTCYWFGEADEHLCHCAGNAQCNKDTGACPLACEDGYFGPACQYVYVSYQAAGEANSLDWLTDNDDTTCNDNNTQSIIITLDNPTILTWMRLFVTHADKQSEVIVSHSAGGQITVCVQTAVVDSSALDILCPPSEAAREITLSGSNIGDLCSLYISGGRNIALNEKGIVQSTTFDLSTVFYASYGVDGRLPAYKKVDFCTHTFGSTATETIPPSWWTLTFSGLVDINQIDVYNRPGQNQGRLIGFTLNLFGVDNTTIFNYTDPNIGTVTWQDIYYISGIRGSNVKKIEIILPGTGENVLTLCEVVVYGDSTCPAGKYGLGCDKNCNCKDNSDCFDHSGGCPAGCAVGYTGENCTTVCSVGTYGDECNNDCSANCAGDGYCNHINGSCNHGCVAGYLETLCDEVCPTGTYGQDCNVECTNCAGNSNSCHHVTGHCDLGCNLGYIPPICSDVCPGKKYGQNCTEVCSSFCAGNNTCHHVTGSCDQGCEIGYEPNECQDECRTGYFGLNCIENCNQNCYGLDNACHHVTGTCDRGCDPGYQSAYCNETCDPGFYGENCNQTCSECGVNDVTKCHHMTGCTDPNAEAANSGGGGGDGAVIGAVIGSIIGVLVIAAIVVGFLLWRRRKGHEKPDEEHSQQPKPKPRSSLKSGRGFSEIGSGDSPKPSPLPSPKPLGSDKTAIYVGNLKAYLLDQGTNALLKEQFESVPQTSKSKTTHGAMAENKKKNRFQNIWPYDQSRVILSLKEGKPHSDYINATHVTKFLNCRSIIASQGPNDFTLNDFIRMLWEKNVDQIVMLTNVVEKAKRKCSQYWPVEGVETFGDISVELLTTRVYAEYTIRHLRLSKDGEKTREVTQYHFTAWPDKSVPDSPWGLVDLYHRVMATGGSGTLLVHCSAGCGRTGTFIAIHHLLKEAEATGKMDFLSTLQRLRADRTQMVQTLDQYKILHRAALIAHMTLGTIIPVRDIFDKLQALESRGTGSKTSPSENGFSKEFCVTQLCVDLEESIESGEGDGEYANSKTAVNKQKNRLSNILPKETHRATVTDDDVKGDIYVNAVLVPNFTKDRHDLLTQLPLPNTVTDFWRLVSMYHVSLMVVFDADSAKTDETIGTFLPENVSDVFEDSVFEVALTEKEDSRQWQELKLAVCKKQMSGHMKAKTNFITCLNVKTTELDSSNWLDILNKVKTCRPAESLTSLYMCRNGATHSGLACVQSILLDRLEVDQCLAVPLVVGAIKAIRPQVIPTVDQYKLLYEVLRQSHDAANVYGNVDDGGSVVPLKPTRPVSSSAVLQPSTNNYEDVDGVMLQARQLAMKQHSVQDRPLGNAKPDVKPAAPPRPNNAESKSDMIVTASAPPKLKKQRHVEGDKQ